MSVPSGLPGEPQEPCAAVLAFAQPSPRCEDMVIDGLTGEEEAILSRRSRTHDLSLRLGAATSSQRAVVTTVVALAGASVGGVRRA